MSYVTPTLIMTGIGLLAGVLLVLFSCVFSVEHDDKFNEIRNCLPGINCSVCGYANCDEYARGILNGDIITKCKPGGNKTFEKLSEVLK